MDDSLRTDGTERTQGPAARPEPVRRAGDTPKQQIRKAKHITRRTFTENARLKQLVADYALDLMALKKSLMAES